MLWKRSSVGENRSKWIINHDFVFYQINDFSLYTTSAKTIIKIIFTHYTTKNFIHAVHFSFSQSLYSLMRWFFGIFRHCCCCGCCGANGHLCSGRMAFIRIYSTLLTSLLPPSASPPPPSPR